MALAPMKFKDFTWPHNPESYTIEYERVMGNHKVPYGKYHLRDMGMTRRVMKGEGEFYGEKAYDQFKALATVFYHSGPGVLIHPVWQTANAYFVELSLTQKPRRDYVRYRFTFWESFDGYTGQTGLREAEESGSESGSDTVTSAVTGNGSQTAEAQRQVVHTVKKGECLWSIANAYGVTVSDLLRLNPQIKNPNLIYGGQEVRVK